MNIVDCVTYKDYYLKTFEDGTVDIEDFCGELVDGGFVDEAAALGYLQEYLEE